MQSVAITDTKVAAQLLTSVPISLAGFETVCTLGKMRKRGCVLIDNDTISSFTSERRRTTTRKKSRPEMFRSHEHQAC